MEFGEYPDVQRVFVPVGCQHCEDPPCLTVCPTDRDRKRDDGIVTIDYDLCIGCAYCAVACPYQARYKTTRASFAYGEATQAEAQRHDTARLAVATKCTFCVDRIDNGLAKGLKPGMDPEATPACVNSCIAERTRLRRHRRRRKATVDSCSPRTSISACTRSWAPRPASSTCGTRERHHEPARADPGRTRPFRPQPLAADELGLARRGQLRLRRRRLPG